MSEQWATFFNTMAQVDVAIFGPMLAKLFSACGMELRMRADQLSDSDIKGTFRQLLKLCRERENFAQFFWHPKPSAERRAVELA